MESCIAWPTGLHFGHDEPRRSQRSYLIGPGRRGHGGERGRPKHGGVEGVQRAIILHWAPTLSSHYPEALEVYEGFEACEKAAPGLGREPVSCFKKSNEVRTYKPMLGWIGPTPALSSVRFSPISRENHWEPATYQRAFGIVTPHCHPLSPRWLMPGVTPWLKAALSVPRCTEVDPQGWAQSVDPFRGDCVAWAWDGVSPKDRLKRPPWPPRPRPGVPATRLKYNTVCLFVYWWGCLPQWQSGEDPGL